jgi:hypothetical protein
MKPRWKQYMLYASVIIIGGGLLYILVQTILVKNTGFETKTLWDWIQLLVVPLVLAIGAFILNRSERTIERQIAEDRQREVALQTYLDRMADLLLKDKLRTTKKREVRDVARIRTLTVLRGLDKRRKGIVLRFLYEAGLISKEPIINLDRADLKGAYLAGANLNGANLTGSFLSEAFLEGVDLSGAKLNKVFLDKAFLGGANLSGADLTEAYLTETNLIGVNLTGAKILERQLRSAKSLEYVTMPDGTKHE